MKTCSCKDPCKLVQSNTTFLKAQSQKQLKCPSASKEINKLVHFPKGILCNNKKECMPGPCSRSTVNLKSLNAK